MGEVKLKRRVEKRHLVGLITRRPQVRILPRQLVIGKQNKRRKEIKIMFAFALIVCVFIGFLLACVVKFVLDLANSEDQIT